MKTIFSFLSLLLMFGCSEYNETLTNNYSSSKDLVVSDFNTGFPVINIKVNQEEFDNMYANFYQEIEIEASLNLYRNTEHLISNELVEIEIRGGSSVGFELKSIGVKFIDGFYDNSERVLLNPKKVLENHSLDEIRAFRLRNSGSDFKSTLIRCVSYTQMAINAELNLDLTYHEPALVFINDDFLGVMNLRSESNANGVAGLNSTERGNITLAKISRKGDLEKKDGDKDRIEAFIDAIRDKNIAFVKEEIDVDNFIDYVIFQSYITNIDWPYNNVRFYSVNNEPFRFVVYDLDMANTKDLGRHPLELIKFPKATGIDAVFMENDISDLFSLLYGDSAFKNKFENRYLELIDRGVFSIEKFEAIVNEKYKAIEKYMPYQLDKYSSLGTMVEWYKNLEVLKTDFVDREIKLKSMKPLF